MSTRRQCRLFLKSTAEFEEELELEPAETDQSIPPLNRRNLLVVRSDEERTEMAELLSSAPHQSRQAGRYTTSEIIDSIRQIQLTLSNTKSSLDNTARRFAESQETIEMNKTHISNLCGKLQQANQTAAAAERKNIADAQTTISKLDAQAQIEHARSEGTEAGKSQTKAQIERQDSEHQVALDNLKAEHDDKIGTLRCQLDEVTARMQQLSDEAESRKKSMDELRSTESALRAKTSDDLGVKNATIDRLEQERATMNQNAAKAAETIKEQTSTINNLQLSAETARKDREEEQRRLKSEITESTARLRGMKSKLDQAKQDAKAAEDNAHLLTSKTIPELQNRNDEILLETKKRHQEAVQQLQADLDSLRSERDQESDKVESLDVKLSKCDATLKGKEIEVQGLKESSAKLTESNRHLQGEKTALNQQVLRLNLRLNSHRAALKARPIDAPASSDPPSSAAHGANQPVANVAAHSTLAALFPLAGIPEGSAPPDELLSRITKSVRDRDTNQPIEQALDGGIFNTDWDLVISDGNALLNLGDDHSLPHRLWLSVICTPCAFRTYHSIVERLIQRVNHMQMSRDTVWLLQESARHIIDAATHLPDSVQTGSSSVDEALVILAAIRSVEVILRCQCKALFDVAVVAGLQNRMIDAFATRLHNPLYAPLAAWTKSAMHEDDPAISPVDRLMMNLQSMSSVLAPDDSHRRLLFQACGLYCVVDPSNRRISIYGAEEISHQSSGTTQIVEFKTTRRNRQSGSTEAAFVSAPTFQSFRWVRQNIES